jgi:hypothetical protein
MARLDSFGPRIVFSTQAKSMFMRVSAILGGRMRPEPLLCVLTLDPSQLLQRSLERADAEASLDPNRRIAGLALRIVRHPEYHPDAPRPFGLLRAPDDRPNDQCAANSLYEIASSHGCPKVQDYANDASDDAITAGIGGWRKELSRPICVAKFLGRRCPLWVNSRHCVSQAGCPLYPQ